MKTIDWHRISDIEFRARKLVMKYPSLAEQNTAKEMIFLLDTIQTLRAQNQTLRIQIKNPIQRIGTILNEKKKETKSVKAREVLNNVRKELSQELVTDLGFEPLDINEIESCK